jgi:Fic family protein
MTYNWQQKDWPEFAYDIQGIESLQLSFMEETGRISGMLHALNDELQLETMIDLMVSEAVKTSAIEGEYLSREDVTSSIRNNLGLNPIPDTVRDKRAQGIGKLMVDVQQTFAAVLTQEQLFSWHTMLMSGNRHLHVGAWRTHAEPMQVVSGALGKEVIHFKAPPSSIVPEEMERFITWFNDSAPGGSREIKMPVVRSAIAHLYFETIHPFEDGNGRIGRAIAEKALSQTLGRPVLLSLSRTIEADKKSYYDSLKNAQRSNEITQWIAYFAQTSLFAQQQARELVDFTLTKTKFFDRYNAQLNERQQKAIKRMFEAGVEGFKGGMNAAKYISITQASKATATRDLQHLAEIGALLPQGVGRSTRYLLSCF